MYVYPVIRTYSTGTSYVEKIFSSDKKAKEYIKDLLITEELHGWKITWEWARSHRDGAFIHKMEKGDSRNAEMWHYERHEVL